MTRAARQPDGQRRVPVSRAMCKATAQRKSIDESSYVMAAQYFSQDFNFVARPGEPVIWLADGQLFPALLPLRGLTSPRRSGRTRS
jgi:hypothetical protein